MKEEKKSMKKCAINHPGCSTVHKPKRYNGASISNVHLVTCCNT